MRFRCPNCQHNIEFVDEQETITEDITCPSCQSRIDIISPEESTYVSSAGLEIGRFKVVERLGTGSFGAVYRAWDDELQRDVAIKIPRPDRLTSTTSHQFLKEARSASRLRHPGVVHVHEVGKHHDQVFIVCDYIDGISLSEWMKFNSPDFSQIASMLAAICDATDSAHKNGIVHRDLKPANILIDKNEQLYVADFGLAKNDAPADATVTRDGAIVGTPAYMSPEQAEGRSADVDNRSDIYSIGVVLYEILTKQKPFSGSNTRTLLHRIQTEQPVPPGKIRPGIPRDLETICLKAIYKAPESRYRSASDFADDLRRFQAGEPIKARPATTLEKIAYRCKKKPYAAACGALAIAVIALGIGLWNQPQPESVIVEKAPPLPTTSVVVQGRRSDGKPLTKCTWAVIPLEKKTRLPNLRKRKLFTDRSKLQLKLVAAEYLIVIDVPGYGFHEVYRNLPNEIQENPGSTLNHLRVEWDKASATAKWPMIVVLPKQRSTDGLVLVPGGDFEMGEGTKYSPKHMRHVDDFWVSPTEVTNAEFLPTRFASRELDPATGMHAANGMTWHSATAYAESVGQRLFTEVEYEYLATGFGKLEVPSGNRDDYKWESWPYGPVGSTNDRMEPYGVSGLLSNVAEWTDSILTPYPGVESLSSFSDMLILDEYQANRVIRGGPVLPGANRRLGNLMSLPVVKMVTVRTRTPYRTMTSDSEVGFRCVRSANARFLE